MQTGAALPRDPSGERRFYLSSSCGVCGKGALEFVRRESAGIGLDRSPSPLAPQTILAVPDRARRRQAAFERTGGLHATALFAADGELELLREDVGRHNAMDKALGAKLLEGRYPLAADGLYACLSGRVSFELVQKASIAGLAGIVAVGAPSTLAVELARDHGMLLCGFVRGESFNVYSGADRLAA